MVRIEKVIDNSLSNKCGIQDGDILISINGHEIEDVLDYRFYLAEKQISIEIERDNKPLRFNICKKTY